jgi:phosphoribosylamine--glycine ligase
MKVLVVGKGGREHAIIWKLLQSPRISSLFCAPGNAGTASIAENVPISDTDVDGLLTFAQQRGIDFTIVGPEAPLAAGIVDRFNDAGLAIFGPTKRATRIESSKRFAKDLMARAGVPTGRAEVFSNFDLARRHVESLDPPIVIKADGLAAGKGVVIADTAEQAVAALRAQMVDSEFGASGDTVLIEEYLEGPEISVFAFVNGERLSALFAAADYQRPGEGNVGPNCGGMGAYSPLVAPMWTDDIQNQVRTTVMEPVVTALADEGSPYIGVLYAGLMLTAQGLRVIEFNCRLGDPETQVILPRLKTDFLDVLQATVDGNPVDLQLDWDNRPAVGVVVASGGYPGPYETGLVIHGLDDVDDDVKLFHAGTSLDQDKSVVTDGGRVLIVTAIGQTYQDARQKAYVNAERITFDGAFYRRDIADFS